MKVSRAWLQDYVDLSGRTADEISRAITFLGFEVEGVHTSGAPALSNVVVGEVLTRDRHPNADKLSVCTVDVGAANGGVKTIVCGAQNYKVGDRVPVALVGAVLPGNFVIKQSAIRGQSSDGMMCSAKELGVAEDAAGLLILTDRPEIGTPINAVLAPQDTVFDIEITPNRPDCLSHLGIARELAAWFGVDFKSATESVALDTTALEQRPDLLAGVRVDDARDCPLYTAHVVAGVKIGPSPAWLQHRLLSIGLRPINNVVDVTNYVMLETGQPLHAFDASRIGGREIIVRKAAEGEKLLTLDGKERSLPTSALVIADAQRPLVVAGIMGGEESGVFETTTDVVLEVAHFRRQSVRATSKQLALSSDSSYRFERGTDAYGIAAVARRAVELLIATAGGKLVGPSFSVGTLEPWHREIRVTPAYLYRQLGFEIPEAAMRSALNALALHVTDAAPADGDKDGPAWLVTVPTWRDDIDRPIDLVEEVLRVYGSDKIPPATVQAPGLVVEDAPVVQYQRHVTDYLAGHDFHECMSYTLRPETETAAWTAQEGVAPLRLANPFVDDQSYLRPTLVGGLLDSLKLNQSRGVAVSRLFETGRVFLERGGKLWECTAVAFVIVADEVGRWRQREAADFYTVKHHLAQVASFAGLDLPRQPLKGVEAVPGWQAGHAAIAGEFAHGWTAQMGLLDLAHTRTLGIRGDVLAGFFAIQPERIKVEATRKRFAPFSLLPAALRDIALVVDAATPADDVRKTVAKAARAAVGKGFAVESVDLFDCYQGAGVPEGRKSLAFSLVFRAPDRTLTDDEVNAAFNRVQADLTAAGHTIRK